MAYEIRKLTKRHLNAIEFIVANPNLSQTELSEKMGVSRISIINWMNSPLFKEALEERLKEVWKDSVKIAQKTMIDLAMNGNRQAAEYILSSNGYLAPQQIELNQNTIKVSIEDE